MTTYSKSRRQFLKTSVAVGALALTAERLGLHEYARADEDADGWITLFDGKTLEGWHKNPEAIGHGTGGDWQVEDGAITGQQDPPGSGNGGILLTDKKFKDFELLIDIKPDWGVCSGLFFRGNDKGQCFQMMVDYHDMGNVGQIYGEGTGGFGCRTFDINGEYVNDKLVGLFTDKERSAAEMGLVDACEPSAWVKAWKLDDWNTVKARVEGEHPRITTWINGLKVCEFDGETSSIEGYNKEDVAKALGAEGSIAVQVHGGSGWPEGAKCRWKNIKIREL
jgi:hypothetical protein